MGWIRGSGTDFVRLSSATVKVQFNKRVETQSDQSAVRLARLFLPRVSFVNDPN